MYVSGGVHMKAGDHHGRKKGQTPRLGVTMLVNLLRRVAVTEVRSFERTVHTHLFSHLSL